MGRKETEIEQAVNKNSYMSIIMSMVSNIIVPINLPEELEYDFDYFLIETLLRNSGFIVRGDDGKFHYAHGNLIEPWDDFGFGKRYIAFNHMGKEWRGTINEDGCIVRPFSSRRPINQFTKTANHLAELETSEHFLVKWARVAPFLLANDNKQKEALLDVVKSVMNGNMTPIVSDNLLHKLVDDTNTPPVVTVDVMQPERIRDLQYLNEHREHIIKEMVELFGIPYQISTKMAQQSKDEINSGNGACYIIPMDILKNFRKFARQLNKAFDLNVDFKLNVLILNELEKYFNQESENNETGENIRDELGSVGDTGSGRNSGGQSADEEHSNEDKPTPSE